MVVLDEVLRKYFNLSNMSHAYLLQTKDFTKIINIVKYVFMQDNENEPNIEKLIEENIYPDLQIIEPEGQWIKKEQISELKEKFKTKSSYNNKQIYVIKNAEHLNKSSGNTLLKFLEEPEENIIAILVTENKNKVLDTLVSRCQYIVLDSNKNFNECSNELALEVIDVIEKKRQNAGYYVYSYIEKITDRKEIKDLFVDIIGIYDKAMLNLVYNESNECDNIEVFDKIKNNNTIEDIKRKINGLALIIDSLEYNINLKLLVDKLIISMFGVD